MDNFFFLLLFVFVFFPLVVDFNACYFVGTRADLVLIARRFGVCACASVGVIVIVVYGEFNGLGGFGFIETRF